MQVRQRPWSNTAWATGKRSWSENCTTRVDWLHLALALCIVISRSLFLSLPLMLFSLMPSFSLSCILITLYFSLHHLLFKNSFSSWNSTLSFWGFFSLSFWFKEKDIPVSFYGCIYIGSFDFCGFQAFSLFQRFFISHFFCILSSQCHFDYYCESFHDCSGIKVTKCKSQIVA